MGGSGRYPGTSIESSCGRVGIRYCKNTQNPTQYPDIYDRVGSGSQSLTVDNTLVLLRPLKIPSILRGYRDFDQILLERS